MTPERVLALLFVVLLFTNTLQVIVGYNKQQVMTQCLDTVPVESRQRLLDELWGISR